MESDITGYKVIEQSDVSLKLQRSGFLWPIYILCYSIIVFLLFFKIQIDNRFGVYELMFIVTVIFAVIGNSKRIGDTRFPSMIDIQQSSVSLYYKNYFGGTREVSYQSKEIESVHPGILKEGRSFRISAVRLFFINGQIVTLTFSSRLVNNMEIALDESQYFTKMFSSIMGLKVISQYFEESA